MLGILALDQATILGWAFAQPGLEPIWGQLRLGKPAAWEGEVYHNLREWLIATIEEFKPQHLVFEAPYDVPPNNEGGEITRSVSSVPQRRRAYGLIGHIVEIADECRLGCHEYQSVEATKYLTGRGRFPGKTAEEKRENKKIATVAACKAFGWYVSRDAADAIALLLITERDLYPQSARTRRKAFRAPTGPLFQVSAQ